MIRIIYLLFFLITLINAQDWSNRDTFDLNSNGIHWLTIWRFQNGDNPEWAKPDFQDSNWIKGNPNNYPEIKPGIHWLRTSVRLTGNLNSYDVLVLRFLAIPVAFEVYWDNALVGKNGKVGLSKSEEISGNASYILKLPHELTTPGDHLLAIRFSNQRGEANFLGFSTALTYYTDWLINRAEYLHFSYLLFGVYLITTFLSLALFLGGRRHRSFFLFAIYAFIVAIHFSIAPINEAFRINIIYNELIYGFRHMVFLSTEILLAIFFIYNFNIPHKKIHLPFVIIIPVLIDILNLRFLFGVEVRDHITMLYSIALLIYAVKNRKTGSIFALVGVLAYVIPSFYINLTGVFEFFPKLNRRILIPMNFIFITSIFFSISRQIREQNRLYNDMKLRSHRLETQLLKSQIQPHFISNTLHSIKSWFRENPKKAEKLIQTLSDEFRIINKISSKKEIPITEEIRICKYHLEIMGSRRNVQFELQTESIPDKAKLPPLIFHTLIENGLTHAYLPDENGKFWLLYKKSNNEVLFCLKNDGSQLKQFSEKENSEIEDGLGLSYIRARLEESYPGKWNIEYGIKNGFWETNIRIRK